MPIAKTLHHLRIATRQSALALFQANFIKNALLKYHPTLTIELVPMITSGDRFLNDSLNKSGGKGLFVKELESALLEEKADIAVHSMKDVPVSCEAGLEIAVICERDDPRDAFVSEKYTHFAELPLGAHVGTSSLRRSSIVKELRPDINIKLLRGNVDTRVKKLFAGEFDAIILAAAGLHRLQLEKHIRHYFEPEQMLPAIGQGAIGIECRSNDRHVKKLLQPLNHYPTQCCVLAERAMNKILGGGCHTPVAGYATYHAEQLYLRGCVASADGKNVLRADSKGSMKDYENIGKQVAEKLLSLGARDILM